LYNQGKPDPEIANAVGVSPQLIFVWRKKNRLPNQSKRKGVVVPPVVSEPKPWVPDPMLVEESRLMKEATAQFKAARNPSPAPSFVDKGGMFFADIADIVPPRKPAIINQDLEDIVADMNAARAAYKAKEVKEIPEDIKREMFCDPETPCTEREDYVTGHEVEPIRSEEVEAQPKPLMHILKCQQPYFDDIWEGYKTFEVRLNDREYEAGDSVLLIAYNAEHSIYETRQIFANIGYLLSGKSFPALLDEETVVFSLINIRRYELQEVGV
jgi:transposase-like protein